MLQLEMGEEHCELVAFDILQQQEAKMPLQALNRFPNCLILNFTTDQNSILRFLVYNVGWVDWAIGVEPGEKLRWKK